MGPAESGDGGCDETKHLRQWILCSVTHCVSDTLLLYDNMVFKWIVQSSS